MKKIGQILVVEDDADTRMLLEHALRLEDHKVWSAANAKEALRMLEGTKNFDLVMVDLSMPEMSGEEFIPLMRRQLGQKKTKILLASGNHEIAKKAQNLLVDGYIKKPYDLDELQNIVLELIQD